MTNPNNAIGTNGAYGGRTSVDAFNDDLAMFSTRGVISGFAITPDSGMTVSLGGDGVARDVAVAEDNVGNKTTINNISKAPISITISGAPANNSRIDSIVAYVEKPAQGTSSAVDNPSACGLIVVEGATASTPVAPDNSAIRTAITSDGASGTTAYYVVLGNITVASGTTTITSNMIEDGAVAPFQSELVDIPDGSITGDKIADDTVESNNLDWTSVLASIFSNTTTLYDNIPSPTGPNEMKFGNGLLLAFGGSDSLASVAANSYRDYTWTLTNSFITPPVVIASTSSNSSAGSFGNCLAVNNITTTGNTISVRYYNNSGSTRTPMVSFIALGRWK